jgi:hypothetical protein
VTKRGRTTRRVGTPTAVGLAAGLAVLAAPAGLPAVAGASHAPDRRASVGHLAFLTNGGAIDLANVRPDKKVIGKVKIGPVQTSTTAHPVTVTVGSLVASGDGKWLAWQENRTTSSSRFSSTLVLRNQISGVVRTAKTNREPVGFAGDTLLSFNRHVVKVVVVGHTLKFVRVAGSFPITTYRHGVVDMHLNSTDTAERLLLTSMSGHRTVLHRYTDIGPPDYRETSQAWVSADGKKLVVERGDHQDFGGLGPSSVVDEYNLHGSHARTTLGHVGKLHAEWRLGDVGFRGANDRVWAVWHALGRHGVRTVLTHVVGGHWVINDHHDIDVAANRAGYLVVQSGKYVLQNPNDNFYARRATGDVMVVHRQGARFSSVRGTQFFWVQGGNA